MMVKNEQTGRWGAGIQAATVFVSKPGYAEKNLCRQGDLYMADEMPDENSHWDRKRIILPGKPYRVDFTMVPAATVKGKLVDEAGQPLPGRNIRLTGDVLPPSSSVAASATTDADGRFQFNCIAPGFQWWFEIRDGNALALRRTQPLTFEQGEHYQVTLQITAPGNNGRMLRITSVKDSQGRDVRAKIVADDPRARPFVDNETAQRAREILDRVAEVNRYWFRALSEDVRSFSYTFHLAGQKPFKLTYQDYVNARSWHREWYPKGISYTGGARVLTSLSRRARFRLVQIDENQITIYFVLQGLPSTVAAGNGLRGTWKGFFRTKMNEGLIRLDAKRLTPISIEYGRLRELYSRYIEVEKGHYVPQRIQILSPGMTFDFRFRLLEPNMWLFDRSFGRWTDGKEEPVAWLTDVTINGQPATPRGNLL